MLSKSLMRKFERPSADEVAVEVEVGGGKVTVVDDDDDEEEEKFVGSTKVRDQFTPIEGSINQSANQSAGKL